MTHPERVRGARYVSIAIAAMLLAACGRVDIESELARARARLDADEHRAALIHASNVIQVEPDNVAARLLRARAALGIGDAVGARSDFERAAALGAPPAQTVVGLAEALLRLGERGAALDALDSAAGAVDDVPHYWTVRGEALLSLQRLEAAGAAFDRSAALAGEESARNLIGRAQLAGARGQAAAAEAAFARALEAAPGDPDVLSARGIFHVREGRLAEGAADLERAARIYAGGAVGAVEANVLSMLVQVRLALNEPDAAVAAAERLSARLPNSAVAQYTQALVAYEQGRFDAALGLLQQIVSRDPGNARASSLLGAVHLALGNLGQAEQHLVDALAQNPGDPAARKLLAETRIRQRRPEAALDTLSLLGDEAAGGDARVALLRGVASLQAGDAERAVRELEQAASSASGAQGIVLNLALAEAQLAGADLNAARETLTALAAEMPEALPVRAALGALELRAGDTARALELARSLQADFPEQRAGHVLEGEARLALREYDTAAEQLARAFELGPDWPLLGRRSVALQLAGRTDEIEALFRDWLEREPDHVPARLALASELQRKGRTDAALEAYERVLALDADNVVALNDSAWLLHERGQPGALARAERAERLAPEHPAVLDTLGWILLGENREQDAVKYLEKAAELAADNRDIQYHFGAALARLGRADEARATLEPLLEQSAFEHRAAVAELLETLQVEP